MVLIQAPQKRLIFNLTTFWVVFAFGLLGTLDEGGTFQSTHFTVLDGCLRIGALAFLYSLAQPSNRSVVTTTGLGGLAWLGSSVLFHSCGLDGVGFAFGAATSTAFFTNLIARFDARHQWSAPAGSVFVILALAMGIGLSVHDGNQRVEQAERSRYDFTPEVPSIEF